VRFLVALNAAVLHDSSAKTTTNSATFSWSLPDGHFDGFRIYGQPSSDEAAFCKDTIYGKHGYLSTRQRQEHITLL